MAPVPTVQQHGAAIRALRHKDGMSVQQLAEAVGCAQSLISHYELEDKQATPQMLARIAKALAVPVAAITRDEIPEPVA